MPGTAFFKNNKMLTMHSPRSGTISKTIFFKIINNNNNVFGTTYTRPSDPKLSRACIYILKCVLIFKYIHIVDKLHPDSEQILMLITHIFVLGENRTHDLWLRVAVRVSNHETNRQQNYIYVFAVILL